MYKTHKVRTTFGSWDVENVHAVVARSTFPSQNAPDHFWQLRCRKSALRAHFEVKMSKNTRGSLGVRTTFGSSDVEKAHSVVARSTFGSQNVKNTRGSDHFWKFRCRFASLHYITLHSTTLHYITLHSTTLQLQLHNYTPLHSTTLNYTTLHSTTLHYTTLHYTTLHYTTLHNTTTTTTQLHSTTLHYITLHYTEWHCTTDRQVDRQTDR